MLRVFTSLVAKSSKPTDGSSIGDDEDSENDAENSLACELDDELCLESQANSHDLLRGNDVSLGQQSEITLLEGSSDFPCVVRDLRPAEHPSRYTNHRPHDKVQPSHHQTVPQELERSNISLPTPDSSHPDGSTRQIRADYLARLEEGRYRENIQEDLIFLLRTARSQNCTLSRTVRVGLGRLAEHEMILEDGKICSIDDVNSSWEPLRQMVNEQWGKSGDTSHLVDHGVSLLDAVSDYLCEAPTSQTLKNLTRLVDIATDTRWKHTVTDASIHGRTFPASGPVLRDALFERPDDDFVMLEDEPEVLVFLEEAAEDVLDEDHD